MAQEQKTQRLERWRLFTSWCSTHRYRLQGIGIFVAAVLLIGWTAVLSKSKTNPPSTAELAILLAASVILQVWAGLSFGRVGHVDGEKAKSAVRRLIRIGETTRELRGNLREALSGNDTGLLMGSAIRAEEGLKGISKNVEDSISDWTDIHSEALRNVLEQAQSQHHKVEEELDG